MLEVLAGIPSVVFGFFALNFIAPVAARGLLGIEVGTFSVLAAGIVLGVMIIPTIASLSEDALSAVPRALRQGSLRWARTRCGPRCEWCSRPRSPASSPPIVLGISRAVGETMIVAHRRRQQHGSSLDPLEGAQTMTGFIAKAAPARSTGIARYNTLFAVGLRCSCSPC